MSAVSRAASSDCYAQQDNYGTASRDTDFEPDEILHSIPSNVTVVGDQVAFYCDGYEAPGSGKAMFQLIRNNHEVIVWGPPLVKHANLMIQRELIGMLLDSVNFDEIHQAMLYIAWDGRARLIPQEEKYFEVPYLGGYRYVEDNQLQATQWLQAGWKRALLDGVRPVEVEYAYNLTSSLALQCMINGCRNLEPLDLTTPVLACLARDGHMIGLVKCIEEGARMVSYKDRRLVYSAFQKMQEHHIYLLDGHDMDPSAVLIVDDKVRFIDMALKRWFSPNVLIYDRMVHDEQELEQARQAHWRQVDLLFDRIDTQPSISNRYRPCEYRLINSISAPRMSLSLSAPPSVILKKQEKRRRRSSETSSDTACDGPYLPGRISLAQRRSLAREPFIRRPEPHMISSETSLSFLSATSSTSLYSPKLYTS